MTIEPASRKVTARADITGAANVLGIDVRPADGMLYGIAADGSIVTIDAKTGQATMKSKLTEMLKAGVTATVDFNPAADRLRVMGSDGTSHRINVDDGKVTVDGSHKFKEGDANAARLRRWSPRLYQFDQRYQGDCALQHRRANRLFGDAGRRRTTACSKTIGSSAWR